MNLYLMLTQPLPATGSFESFDLLRAGETVPVRGSKKPLVVKPEHLEAMVASVEKSMALGKEIPIDWEHATRLRHAERSPAAGWIDRLYIETLADGTLALRAHVKEWTEAGLADITSHAYKYTSLWAPLLINETTGDVEWLHVDHVALTNKPGREIGVPLGLSEDEPPVPEANGGKIMKEKLIKLLGLSADASDEQVLEAVGKHQQDADTASKAFVALGLKEGDDLVAGVKNVAGRHVVAHPDVLKALGLSEEATLTDATGAVVSLKAGDSGMAERIRALEAKMAADRINGAVIGLKEEGKLTEAEEAEARKLFELNFEAAEAAYKKRPALALSQRLTTSEPPKDAAIDDAQKTINTQLVLSDEEFKKYQKREGK